MKLTEHLQKVGKKPYKWAEAHGLPKDPVYRHLRGKTIEYATALKISAATDGAVSVMEIME